MHRLENLKVLKKAIELVKQVYLVVPELPNDEKFGLTAQIKRSSVSIPSNIAEGAGRNSKKEFKHFLGIANGSCYELQTQLVLIVELQLLPKESVQHLIELCTEIQKMNYSLQKTLTDVELSTQY